MHIGLIGGIGPAATEFYYRNLVEARRSSGATKQLELTICHADAGDLIRNIQAGSVDSQVRRFAILAKRLEAAGADFLAVTSIGGHFCISELEAVSPIPVINALSGIERWLSERDFQRVGILGNKLVMETRLFDSFEHIEIVAPSGDSLNAVHEAYMSIAMSGTVTEAQRHTIFQAGRAMYDKQGAETIVLAGTDLFVAFDRQECGFDYMDSALVHVDAIHRASLYE